MSEGKIGAVVARQYDRMWSSLRDAVSQLSDAEWRTSDCEWLAPIRLAYHLVETAEYYRGASPDDGAEPLDWDNGPTDALPSQQQLLLYLDRVQASVREWLTTSSDEAFLSPQTVFERTGETLLDRAIYSLRHSQHHLGQINAELRRKGLPRGKWD
ncbi:MAG TPA: DinB family protein [Pirellulales bacterium]